MKKAILCFIVIQKMFNSISFHHFHNFIQTQATLTNCTWLRAGMSHFLCLPLDSLSWTYLYISLQLVSNWRRWCEGVFLSVLLPLISAVEEEGLSVNMSLTLRSRQVLMSHILLYSIQKGLDRQTFEWVLKVWTVKLKQSILHLHISAAIMFHRWNWHTTVRPTIWQ